MFQSLFRKCKSHFFQSCPKEKKKEHKDESVVFTETGTDDEEEDEVARVTYVNNILHSIFSNVELYINNQQIYNSNRFTNLLWQCLEILEGKSQLLTMSYPRMNKKYIQLPQLMKTA